MNYDIISAARTRIEAARFRKAPEFGRRVEEAVREALTQPFGEPLAVARVHSRSPQPHRRAVWQAVVAELERNPSLQGQRRVPVKIVPDPETLTDRRRYRVDLLTDVGPDTPGGRLNRLAMEGRAAVASRRSDNGEPCLLYYVPEELACEDFEALRDDVASPAVAAE